MSPPNHAQLDSTNLKRLGRRRGRLSLTYAGQIQFKLLPIILVLLLVFLQYKLWYGSGGIKNMVALKKQLASQTQINDVLKKQNQGLLDQVRYLQANKDTVESLARQELGMIKKGEMFYQIIK